MFRTYYHNAYHLFFINLQHHIMHSSYRKNKANWLRKTEHSYKKHNIVFASKRTLPTQRTIKWLIESQKVIPWIGGNWVQFAFRLLPAFEVHLLILKRRHTIFFENNIARKLLFVNYKSYLFTQRLDQPLYTFLIHHDALLREKIVRDNTVDLSLGFSRNRRWFKYLTIPMLLFSWCLLYTEKMEN